MAELKKVETQLAVIERTSPNLVETRFKEDVRITVEGMNENIRARHRLCAEIPHAMLTVMPAGAEFDPDILRSNLFQFDGPRAQILAIAVVTHGPMISMIARLYFSYFPQVTRTRLFNNEAEARAWLDLQLAEMGFSAN